MGIIETKEKLRKLLCSFHIHPDCLEEIIKGFKKKRGNDVKLLAVFEAQFENLKKYGATAVNVFSNDKFEDLKYKKAENICSMHIDTSEVNYRILYSCLEDGTVLLHGFFEKAGKRKTDYTDAIPKAQKRLAEWKESHHD
mgnify:FL=1|jgi:hypothetical protein